MQHNHDVAQVYIFGNYDGGVLEINIDEDIPNIMIGAVSYRPHGMLLLYSVFAGTGCSTNI